MGWQDHKYRGKYLFNWEPDWSKETPMSFDHPYDVWHALGADTVWDVYDETRFRLSMKFLGVGREQIQEMDDFFDNQRGRWAGLWVPSWLEDLNITAAFGASDTQLTIEDVDYANTWLPNDNVGRHIILRWPDNSYKVARITGAPDSTTITLSKAVGKAAAAADLQFILCSFLYYGRFEQDEIEWQYFNTSVANAELSFKTIIDVETTTSSSTTSSSTTSSSTTSSTASTTSSSSSTASSTSSSSSTLSSTSTSSSSSSTTSSTG